MGPGLSQYVISRLKAFASWHSSVPLVWGGCPAACCTAVGIQAQVIPFLCVCLRSLGYGYFRRFSVSQHDEHCHLFHGSRPSRGARRAGYTERPRRTGEAASESASPAEAQGMG